MPQINSNIALFYRINNFNPHTAYTVPFINYALARRYDLGLSKKNIDKQKEKYGETLIGRAKIFRYILNYYNESREFEPRPVVINPQEYCEELNLQTIEDGWMLKLNKLYRARSKFMDMINYIFYNYYLK
ncbi:uncharacterized protein LOC112595267 [Melanaphis sacchari]|uniref:uncharacterized protein LOC112595267 n=1 Tax=Melanaphis sacchari TaxID=742174 RepID=UPI000DC1476F|nr:uncharacterized protein LOC112595267 [Melanaphis sacchari]